MTVVDKPNQQAIHTIFIADDDEDDRQFVIQSIRDVNPTVAVKAFNDCGELRSMLQVLVPDLIFLDLDMPRKNGLECMVDIRANPSTSDIPIIVFSSTSRNANIQVAYEMGADLFIIKPHDLKSLISALERVLKLNWKDPKGIKESMLVNGTYKAMM